MSERERHGRRRLAVALLVAPAALTAACGAQPAGNPPASPEAGVRGVVILWPVCPVEGAPETRDDCRSVPAEAAVHVRDRASDAVVATAHSGPDGRFRVPLRAGEYVVTAETPRAGACKPETVTVPPGVYADVTIRCDTGIR